MKERGDVVKKSQIECRMLKTKKEHYKERTRQKMVETLIVFGQKYHSRHVNLVLKLRVNPNLGSTLLSR